MFHPSTKTNLKTNLKTGMGTARAVRPARATRSSRPWLLLGGLSLLALAALHPAPVRANPPGALAGWTQTFSDNFSGTSLNTANNWNTGWAWGWGDGSFGGTHDWRPSDHNFGGYPASNLIVNNGLTVRSAQESFKDDQGVLHAYTSGALSTAGHFSQTYGYFETSIQMANTPGLDCGLWMLPANLNDYAEETDIVEVASGKNWGTIAPDGTLISGTTALLTKHYPSGASDGTQFSLTPAGTPFSAKFHTFALDWEPASGAKPASMTWYIDGTMVKHDTDSAATPLPSQPMFMLLNNELEDDTLEGRNDGDWTGNPDSATYPGHYPAFMYVAYVRVWRRNPAPPTPTGLSATAGASGMINVVWSASPYATMYNVQRSVSGGKYALLKRVTTTSLADTGLTTGTTYSYKVVATDPAGASGAAGPVSTKAP